MVARLVAGRTLYIHCRGGHGRTGTVCSLLLGRLYGIGAAEAMARYQWYHDTRAQPIFAAEGYALNTSANGGESCVALFPEQVIVTAAVTVRYSVALFLQQVIVTAAVTVRYSVALFLQQVVVYACRQTCRQTCRPVTAAVTAADIVSTCCLCPTFG